MKNILIIAFILFIVSCKKDDPEPAPTPPDTYVAPVATDFSSMVGEWLYYKQNCSSDNFSESNNYVMEFNADLTVTLIRISPADTFYYTASGDDGLCEGLNFLQWYSFNRPTTFNVSSDTLIFTSTNCIGCGSDSTAYEYWIAN